VPGAVTARNDGRVRPEESLSFREALRDRLVLALTINSALISVTFGASFSFLSLRLEEDLGVTPTLIGLAISTQDLTAGLSQPFFGRLADRRERGTLVAAGLLALGGLLMVLGAATNYWIVVLILLGMGAANALAAVAASAIQVVAGRRVGMGTVLGLNAMGNGAGILVGSILGGVVVSLLSIPAAFFFAGLVVIAGAPIFVAMTRGLAMRDDGPHALEPAIEPAAAAQ
jgi:MFS family permease